MVESRQSSPVSPRLREFRDDDLSSLNLKPRATHSKFPKREEKLSTTTDRKLGFQLLKSHRFGVDFNKVKHKAERAISKGSDSKMSVLQVSQTGGRHQRKRATNLSRFRNNLPGIDKSSELSDYPTNLVISSALSSNPPTHNAKVSFHNTDDKP